MLTSYLPGFSSEKERWRWLTAWRCGLRAQERPQKTPPAADDSESDNTIVFALTSQITHLKKQHRDESSALRTALERAHGENLQLRRELTRFGWTGEPATT